MAVRIIPKFKSLKDGKNAQFLSYMEKFVLPECQKGNIRFFDDAQRVFTDLSDKQLQIDIATANEKLLRDISVKKLVWLSENFRFWKDEYYACDHDKRCIDRKKLIHLTDSQYLVTLKLGTFASNGYYRQQCMEQLRDAEGSLPFLILRMNDWVAPIREKAYDLSRERMQGCGLYEFFQSLPMLEKVKNARRRSDAQICSLEIQAENLIRHKFQSLLHETLDEIPKFEIQIKNAVYRFINKNPVLDRAQTEHLLALERTGYGQMLLILAIFCHYHYDDRLAAKYLCSKSAVVRYHTLVYRYEQEHDAWPGLKDMLLDSSKRIRDYAGYILKKCTDMDIAAFYRKELDRNVSKTVLSGIGTYGVKSDIDLIRPYLEDERQQICKAALDAFGKLAESDGDEIYWRFLFDIRPVIARQAYRCIQKCRIPYGALRLYEAYIQTPSDQISDYLLHLLMNEPSWARLPYLLMLYCNEDLTENQRQAVTAGICFRHMYGSVSGQEAGRIRSLLEQNGDKIPAYISKGILIDLKYVVRE